MRKLYSRWQKLEHMFVVKLKVCELRVLIGR